MNDKAKYFKLDSEKQEKVDTIREIFSSMYDFLEKSCKSSKELSLAMTRLEEAQFWATKGITREED